MASADIAPSSTSMTLNARVKQVYDRALESRALIFFPSTTTEHMEDGMTFEIRVCPALSDKPKGSAFSEEKETDHSTEGTQTTKKPNPFLPYDPSLWVDHIGPKHNLLLNKFSLTPGHLLLTTREFVPQEEGPNRSDIFAALATLDALAPIPYMTFFNGGPLSGASQPHKHLQLFPLPRSAPFAPPVLTGMPPNPVGLGGISSPYYDQGPFLPFLHVFAWLPRTKSQEKRASWIMEVYLHARDHLGLDQEARPSYNVLFTHEWVMVVKRARECTDQGISINSLGFAGYMVAKSREEALSITETGVLEILSQVGEACRPSGFRKGVGGILLK